MACEFAGQADSLKNFYNVIIDGVDATSHISESRWNVDLKKLPPSILNGGFLRRNPWEFDNQFFSISPKEAARIDPQHRMLLENTYHAFEDANIDPDNIKDKKCGVFIGLGTQDYSRLMHNSGDFEGLHSKGSLGSMAAGRISYHFDLVGPTFVVDTACSSSLVALHQAVRALQLNQCDLAVVGGATLILTIDYNLDLANAGLLAKDGRCKPFSRYADGFARGEGAGIIILERHHDAINHKRRIYANILGCAINGDGKTNGITAPSRESQKRIIKDALLDANLSPEEVNYIETHGTGTDLGDKIEFAALCDVYQGRKNPLYLGAVKGNIAHCEAAAGIAGVIKTSLCIYNNIIPPHSAAHSVNSELRHDLLHAKFPKQVIKMEKIIGSISSFGMSGSNAHVLLGPNGIAHYPVESDLTVDDKNKPYYLFLSAKSAESLDKLSKKYRHFYGSYDEATLQEALGKCNMSRKHWLHYRQLVHGNDRADFIKKLEEINLKGIQENFRKRKIKIAFLFTGQGAVYKNMTRLLYESVMLYRDIFDKYAAKIDANAALPKEIKNYIFNDDDSMVSFPSNTTATQLSLFLVEFSLAEFFGRLGVKPDYVVGHSLGEYAAACVAGILSFEHAAQMIIFRSQEAARFKNKLTDFGITFLDQAESSIRMISTVEIHSSNTSNANFRSFEYWEAQITQPVRFNQAIDICHQSGVNCFIELGPDSILTPLTSQCLRGVEVIQEFEFMSALIKNKNNLESIFKLLNILYVGNRLDCSKIHLLSNRKYFQQKGFMPPYPFARTELLPEFLKKNSQVSAPKNHTSLKIAIEPMRLEFQINFDLLQKNDTYITQHVINNMCILPGSYYPGASFFLIEKLCNDYLANKPSYSIEIKNLLILRPVIFTEADKESLKVLISQQAANQYQLAYFKMSDLEKAVCEMTIYLKTSTQPTLNLPMHAAISKQSADNFYRQYAACGVNYGPLFKRVQGYYRLDANNIIAEILPPADHHEQYSSTHAVFLDHCFQTIALCLNKVSHAYAPTSIMEYKCHKQERWDSAMKCHATITANTENYLEANLNIYNAKHELLIEITGIACQAVDLNSLKEKILYHVSLEKVEHISRLGNDQRKFGLIANLKSSNTTTFLSLLSKQQKSVTTIESTDFVSNKEITEEHLIYLVDSVVNRSSESVFYLFDRIYRALRVLDDKSPGRLKVMSIVSCQDRILADSRRDLTVALMRAIVLAFPTEFPTIKFQYFRYDAFTEDNINHIFHTNLSADANAPGMIAAPFWYVRANELYQYRATSANLITSNTQSKEINKEGYYLITGGLGGVGKQLMRYMIKVLGCKNIIITYSKVISLNEENLRFIEELRSNYAANIIYEYVDLTEETRLVELFQKMPRPLYGIFHLAGINIDQTLAKTNINSINDAFSVKSASAWKLHELSLEIKELNHFVLFSSVATLISSPGQFSYALANLALVDLAEYRNDSHLPITIVDWGPWSNTGMMANLAANSKSSVALKNFHSLEASLCCESLFDCLGQKDTYHFAVFKLNKKANSNGHIPVKIGPTFKLNPLSTKDEVEHFIKDLLITLIVQETDHKISNINENILLSELGLDSINTIRIRAELQAELNLSIPLSLLLDDPSISSITNQLTLLWLEGQQNSPAKVDADVALVINKKDENEFYPLSYNQFSIWYEQQAIPNNTAYHCSIGWKITGEAIYLEQLTETWQLLIQLHEMLRALFTHQEGVLGYKIVPLSIALEYSAIVVMDLKAHEEVDSCLKNCLTRKIDFQNELPTKVFIVRKQNDVYLMLSSHHIVMDAAAIFNLGEKLLRALCDRGFKLNLTPISASYQEFTEFQKQQKPEDDNNAIQFLLKETLDENNNLRTFELPKKAVDGPVNLALGGSSSAWFHDKEMQVIMSLPPNMRVYVCLSAWALLLAKYTGESSILVGIAMNGRTKNKWTDVIGHFVNLLPMCISVDQHETCLNFLNSVKRHLIDILEFQDLPLVKLMMQDSVKNVLQGRKLLQTYFNYFDASELNIKINNPALQIQPLVYPQQEAQFEISLWVTRDSDKYSFDIKYQADLFSKKIMENITQHYKKIILSLSQALLKNESVPRLCDLKLFSVEEEEKMLPIEKKAEQHTKFVYQHFRQYALHTPEAIAIEMRNKHITYNQLHTYVEKLAETIAEFPRENDGIISILSPERANIEFIICVLALWKQGYSYLPLNIHHPLERIKYALNAVGCKKIITIDENLSAEIRHEMLNRDDVTVLNVGLSADSLEIKAVKQTPAKRQLAEHNQQRGESKLAYVLFTSGSTGFPKGVLVEHDGLIDRLLWMKEYFSFTAKDKFLQSTILTFDVSLPEFCLPLISGGTTVLFDPADNPNAHAKICQSHLVTMMSTVPSLFSILQDDLSQCQSLRHLILVGEALPPAMVNQWLSSHSPCTLYNLYGPTEVTVYATAFPCLTPVTSSLVPIGAPCQNVIPLVLDSYGNLVPEGVVGELYLSGTGVARCYIGKEIVENPFANNPFQSQYSRIYKTGDFVRWLNSNTLEYIGRKDNRVKLHGLLIELGEIEQHVLKAFSSIKNAAAIVVDIKSNDRVTKHIILCVMPLFSGVDEIMSHLQQHLPKYMLPWKIFSYEDFPRNSSRKIDRKALCKMVHQSFVLEVQPTSDKINTHQAITMSYLEKECLKIWQNLLHRNDIGLDTNFFYLGGDSLLLTQMTLLVEKGLSVNVNFAKFLSNPTINSLINGITQSAPSWAEEIKTVADFPNFERAELTNAVLLTGVTGHLGMHLLRSLIERTDKQICLIIRADSIQHACDRLNQRYKNIFSSSIDFNRVCIYVGDLSHPKFLLDETLFSDLCQKISIIIHAAAEVNHMVDYTRLKINNVIATKNIINLARLSNCAHLFHISTQFTETDCLPESYMEDFLIDNFISGYEQSKFIAESLMHTATKRGYPVSTLRLPLIIDGHDPYLLKQNHFVAFIMKCLRMGYYPDVPLSFDVLPTDHIALFITQQCAELSHSQVYNCLQQSIHLTDIFDFLNSKTEFRSAKIDYQSWRDQVIESTDVNDPFYRLLPLYTQASFPLNESMTRKVENISYLKQVNKHDTDNISFELIETISQFLANFYYWHLGNAQS
jgi:amino acid adenylation domain-containing protein/thioester reductase-like protein